MNGATLTSDLRLYRNEIVLVYKPMSQKRDMGHPAWRRDNLEEGLEEG